MTDLADEIERLCGAAAGAETTARQDGLIAKLYVLIEANLPAILTALRASRPEPAADAVEAAATRVADATLCQWGKPGDCGREDNPCLCEVAAKAALAASRGQDHALAARTACSNGGA